MADIKLYGKIHNQDGNLLVSPLEVAGVNTDGSIPEGAATSENNIVSYINEKIKGVNTNVGNIKTGIKSVEFSNTLLTYSDYSTKLTVTGNDGTSHSAYLDIDGENIIKDIHIENDTSAPVSFGMTNTLAYLSIDKWNGTGNPIGSIDITLPDNNAVGAAWEKSTTATNYKQSVTSAINTAKSEANNYTDTQINAKLGKVYKPQGNTTLSYIVTINPRNSVGNVWNMKEKFMIDGEVYPKYTNVVIVDSESLPTTLEYNKKTGFSSDVVDALGGMFDQTAIQNDINNKFNKSIVSISTNNTPTSFNPIDGGDIVHTITYTLGDKTTGSFDIKLRCNASRYATTKEPGVVKLGVNTSTDFENKLYVVDATNDIHGAVCIKNTSSISNTNGVIDVKLANDSGIKKSANGELSITKNTFTAGTGIDIKKTGNDFAIGFNTTYVSDAASPAGQPLYYNKTKNGFYVNTDSNLSVTTDTDKSTKISINTATLKSTLDLNSKADVSTVTALSGRVDTLEAALPKKADSSALAALTSRVEALESLLSLG